VRPLVLRVIYIKLDSECILVANLIWPIQNKWYLIQFYRTLGDPGNVLDQQGYRLEVRQPSDTE
jgi:hypothetical protein